MNKRIIEDKIDYAVQDGSLFSALGGALFIFIIIVIFIYIIIFMIIFIVMFIFSLSMWRLSLPLAWHLLHQSLRDPGAAL